MKLNRQTIDLLMAKKCWGREELLKESGISDFTYYKSFKEGVSPKYAGLIAKALNAKVEDIIMKEE